MEPQRGFSNSDCHYHESGVIIDIDIDIRVLLTGRFLSAGQDAHKMRLDCCYVVLNVEEMRCDNTAQFTTIVYLGKYRLCRV